MSGRVLLYGATGFSGMSIAEELASLGDRLVLAGRDAAALAALGSRLSLPCRAVPVDDPAALDAVLADVGVVLNAAGPFEATAAPMIASCLRTRSDYLDIAGEWPVFRHAMSLDEKAREAGVMLLPGAAFGIAVTDCLLALAAAALPDVAKLRLGLSRAHALSRGSVRTLATMAGGDVLARRDGELRREPLGRSVHDFDFGAGRRAAAAIAWPDVVTGQFSTGVPTVEAFAEIHPIQRAALPLGLIAAPVLRHPAARSLLDRAADLWPQIPEASGGLHGYVVVAEAEDRWRRTAAIRVATPDGYTATRHVASAIVRAVLAGKRSPGFVTPSRLLGPDFLLGLPGVTRLDTAVHRETAHAVH